MHLKSMSCDCSQSSLQVGKFKQAFLKKLDEKPELYDVRDLQRLATVYNTSLVLRFMRLISARNGHLEQAVNALSDFLKWRKARKVNDLRQADFPHELYEWGMFEYIPDEKKASFTLYFRMAL